jgi:hypothetical protein
MLRPAIFEPTGPLFFDRVFHDFFDNSFSRFDNFNTDVIDNGETICCRQNYLVSRRKILRLTLTGRL